MADRPVLHQTVAVTVFVAQTLRGCPASKGPTRLKRVDDKTLSGSYGRAALALTRQ